MSAGGEGRGGEVVWTGFFLIVLRWGTVWDVYKANEHEEQILDDNVQVCVIVLKFFPLPVLDAIREIVSKTY